MKRAATALAAVLLCVLASASVKAQSVVVNKYFNSGTTADVVELLVVQDALDMRGMFIKDFSSNMANDGGGKYQFSTNTLWSAVPAGTLIVLRNDTSAADASVGGGDFNVDVGLQNATYFTNAGGTFDIATTEMVMIKTAASGAAGVTGNIHTLAGGTAGAQFTATTGPKLRATGTSATNQFVFANSSTQTLADYNGTDATGAATGLTFGAGNNANNTAYINSLRVVGPAPEPTTQASNVIFTNVGATSLTVSWTNGNGSGRVVLAKQDSPVDAVPVDGTSYTANAAFGSGSALGPVAAVPMRSPVTGRVTPTTTTMRGATITATAMRTTTTTTTTGTGTTAVSAVGSNYVVFAGNGNSVTVTNLQPSTTYHFAVFEFNGSNAGINYLTTNPATGSQTTAVGYQISGTVRAGSGTGLSGVAVALSQGDTPVANAVTDANGVYSFSNVTAGADYSVTPSSTSFKFSPASATVSALGSNQVVDFTGTPRVIIGEFRFRGTDPDGAGPLTASANDFVELYNQTDESATATGWTLRSSDGTTLLTFPATVIAARSHYLVAGSGYGLSASASANSTLGADIADGAGVALFNNPATFDASTRLDATGFAGVGDPVYREGSGLTPAGGVTSDAEFSFVRRMTGGLPSDTDDNEADFLFVSTDGGIYGSRQSSLGAPGPENSSSPLVRNSQVALTLLDPAAASSSSPNRVRDFTSDPANNSQQGTMSIRRTLVNHTGANVTSLRFRIIDMTTYPTPAGTADLRALTSGPISVTVTGGASKTVQGTTLETPPAQPQGGGLNSTLAAGTVTLGAPLADGASIDLQFLLGVQASGYFRFFVNVEAVATAPASASEHLVMGNPSNAVADVNQPTNYLLDKPQFVISYHRDRGIPNWVSWHLDSTWLGSAPRQNDFRPDSSLPADWYHVQATDYQGSGFDRGHHTPSADRTNSVATNSATFLMTNMMPQAPDNNQGPWEQLESYSRTLVSGGNELYIVAGGAGTGGTGSNGGTTTTVASGHVTVPNVTWKVIMVLPAASGDDVSRVTTSTRVIAIIMPNTQGIRTNTWQQYRVSVDQVEALTGFDFFSNVPTSIQNVIEAQVDNQ
jgi:endonuclease G, mitochondrial